MRKISIILIAVLYSTVFSLSAQTFNNSGFQQLKIGDIDAIVLSDGYYPVSSVQPFIAPAINPKLVNKELFAHHLPETNLRLAINVLLLKIGDHLVLIDAGAGQEIGSSGGWLADNLKLIGISPDQITDIVTTHVHLDHTGGLIDENGKSKYPNATIYISKDEYQFWEDGYPDFSKSKIEDESIKSEMNIFANRILNPIKPQIQLVQDGDIILDHIKINLAPGHTDGHYIATIFSNGESIVHIADLIHVGEVLFVHPEWGNGLDSNFDLGVKTRLDVLKNLKNKDALIIGAHLAYPGIGHIKEIKKNSYEWEPAYFSTPQIRE